MNINWNGCWENKGVRIVCRWMIAWVVNNNYISGCIAGYSGGGCFQLEKFFLKENDFSISADDEFSEMLSDKALSEAEDCQDFIINYHDENIWFESDNLVLKHTYYKSMRKNGDLLFGASDEDVDKFKELFNRVGLTAVPKFL